VSAEPRPTAAPTGAAPLWRNRDFVLMQAGRLLSTAGTESTTIAYPLLVLALTHSPAQAGVVTFARLLPSAVLALPAGLAADRWDRRRLMIGADVVRAVAMASLGAAIVAGDVAFWWIAAVALVEGCGSVVFTSAQAGALRAVVPARQLPTAVGAEEARNAAVRLAGPPVGGFLFGIGRAVPFLVDAASYTASIVSLGAMRTPFQERREAAGASLRAQIADGFRFLWGHPFLRTCAFLYGFGNFTLPGVFLVVVVVGERQGLSGGRIGLLFAVFGACTLAGSLLSPLLRRALSMRTILWIELWAGLGSAAFLVRPDVYVLTAGMLPLGVAMPVTDSVVVGYRIAVTPDRLLGRVEGVRRNISLLLAPLGPLVAGVLLSAVSAQATIAVFLALAVVLVLWGMLSPSIRHAPSLAELDELAPMTAPPPAI
jgi:Transmembrane secretion effector